MELGQHYRHYWRRMELRAQAAGYRAPCLRWYHGDRLNPAERVVFDRVCTAARLLDFGAGDLRLERKFSEAGFAGRYETLDVSEEFPHDYTDLGQVSGPFGAILCLEVIEHLPLAAFDGVVGRLCELLEPGGVLVISTPNPLCVVPMWAAARPHRRPARPRLRGRPLPGSLRAGPSLRPAAPAPAEPASALLPPGRRLRRRPARDRHPEVSAQG